MGGIDVFVALEEVLFLCPIASFVSLLYCFLQTEKLGSHFPNLVYTYLILKIENGFIVPIPCLCEGEEMEKKECKPFMLVFEHYCVLGA